MASGQLYQPVGGGSAWPGAIVGDLPNPSGCAVLDAGEYLTSGDLDLADPGEVSGQNVFTIEFWFRAGALPVGSEEVAYGPMTTTGTGFRQWRFYLGPTGTFVFEARNTTPSTISISAGLIVPGTWYHIVGKVDGSTLKTYQNAIEVGSIGWTGSVQARGTTAGSMDVVIGSPSGTVTYSYDEVAIYRSALGADRILAHYQAGVQRGFVNNQLPSERVIQALDAATSQAPRRIGAGSRRMQPKFMTGQAAIEEIQLARQAENVDATTFASKDGEVVFLDAAHRSSAPYNTVQMTLGDAGGTELAYEDLGMDYSEDVLANEWSVTRTNGLTQTVSDATSIARYYRCPQSITDLPLQNDTTALAVANGMLAKYKDPILRGTSIALDPSDPDVAAQVFDRDLADKLRVLRTPPGGGARLDQNLFIQQIEISGDNSGAPWDVTWGLSPL